MATFFAYLLSWFLFLREPSCFIFLLFIFHMLTLFHVCNTPCYLSEDIQDSFGYLFPFLLGLIFSEFVLIVVFCDTFSSDV